MKFIALGLIRLNQVCRDMDSAFLATEPNQKQVLVETNGETYLVHLPDNDFLTNQSDQEVLNLNNTDTEDNDLKFCRIHLKVIYH